jgi:hypothetical protein
MTKEQHMPATIGAFFTEEEKNLDFTCLGIIEPNINMLVPWYLLAAYAYYVEDDPIISDHLFDRMAKQMLECWDKIEHRHKSFITKADLEAGTFLGEYPSRVEGGLKALREIHYGKDARKSNSGSPRRGKNS